MEMMMDCSSTGHAWLMATPGITVYGVLLLAGAALVKYLFFSRRPAAAN